MQPETEIYVCREYYKSCCTVTGSRRFTFALVRLACLWHDPLLVRAECWAAIGGLDTQSVLPLLAAVKVAKLVQIRDAAVEDLHIFPVRYKYMRSIYL